METKDTSLSNYPRHVDTDGHCFLCLIKLEPESTLSLHCHHEVNFLWCYLRLDLDKVYNDVRMGPLLGGGASMSKKLLTVSLCDGCAPLSDRFSELYKQLEYTRMELISYLNLIHGKMRRAEDSGLSELFRKSKGKSRKGLNKSRAKENLKIVEALRKETMEKCLHKVNASLPTVEVQKLAEEDLAAQMSENVDVVVTLPHNLTLIKSGDVDVDVGTEMQSDPDYLPEEDGENFDLDYFDEPFQPHFSATDKEFKNKEESKEIVTSDIPAICRRPRTKSDLKKVPLVAGNSRFNSKTGKRKCNHCPREFVYASAFLNHYKDQHLKLRHECGLCGMEFASNGNLSRHHRKVHMGLRYGCDTCSKIFSYKSNLRKHQALDNCSLGGKGFRTKSKSRKADLGKNEPPNLDADNPQEPVSGVDKVAVEGVKKTRKYWRQTVVPVDGADGVKSNARMLPPTVIQEGGTPPRCTNPETGKHECFICSGECKNLESLYDHYKADHPNHSEVQHLKLSYQCSLCRKKFAQRGNYTRHHRNAHMGVRYSCEICKRLFSLKANLRKHQRLDNCLLEGKGFRTTTPKGKKLLTKMPVDGAESDSDPEAPPLEVGIVVQKVKKKRKHQRQPVEIVVGADAGKSYAPILPPTVIQEEDGIPQSGINPETGKHECRICSKEFKDLSVLSEHYRAIHLKRRFKCNLCEKQFSYRQVYNAHYHKVHIAASYRCHGCDEVFTRKLKLKEHQRETSCGEGATSRSKVQCHQCGKEFARQINLKRHVDSVHLKLREHICDQCGRGFDSNGHLKNHLRTVHAQKIDNKGPLECKFCKKQFPIKEYLRLHLRTHTGEKPYVCEHCGKTFAARSNWNRHREMHSQEGHHKCPQCNRLFPDQSKLVIHQERTRHGY